MSMSSEGALVLGLFLVLFIGTIAWATRSRLWSQLSWRGYLIPALPSILMAVSFYSLAMHMYFRLNGWPASIGEAGFSRALALHSEVAEWCFAAVFLSALYGWPVALLVCVIFKAKRKYIAHLAVFGVAFALCFGLVMLGPHGFLNWWWD